jgi:hypothetical protein
MKNLIGRCLLAAGLVLAATSARAGNILFDSLSLAQGSGFKLDVPQAFGFITTLNFAALPKPMTQDISVKTPPVMGQASQSKTGSVVGVLQSFQWSGGLADPIALKFNVSQANKTTLLGMLHTTMTNTAVQLGLVVYTYDQATRLWFTALASQDAAPLKGNIAKQGGKTLELTIASQASQAVTNQPTWEVDMTMMPQPIGQQMLFATAPNSNVIKSWGLTVGALAPPG